MKGPKSVNSYRLDMPGVLVVGLYGAVFGVVIGSTSFAGLSFLNESFRSAEIELQWVFAAAFVGAKLGLVFGALAGSIIGLAIPLWKKS